MRRERAGDGARRQELRDQHQRPCHQRGHQPAASVAAGEPARAGQGERDRQRHQADLPAGDRAPGDRHGAGDQPRRAPGPHDAGPAPERCRRQRQRQPVRHDDLAGPQHDAGRRDANAGHDSPAVFGGVQLGYQQDRCGCRPGPGQRVHQLARRRRAPEDGKQHRDCGRVAAGPEQHRQRRAVPQVRPDGAGEPEVRERVLAVEAVEREHQARDRCDQQRQGERPARSPPHQRLSTCGSRRRMKRRARRSSQGLS